VLAAVYGKAAAHRTKLVIIHAGLELSSMDAQRAARHHVLVYGRRYDPRICGGIARARQRIFLGIAGPIYLMLAFLGAGGWFMRYTTYGSAVGVNRDHYAATGRSARLTGGPDDERPIGVRF
jgi:hypothetical protein